MQVTLYSKPDCPLCDDCKAELYDLQAEFAFLIDERNILDDAALFTQFRYLIPVVDIAGGPLLYPPHTRRTLWDALHSVRPSEEATHGAAPA
jgi:hypothetical protein